MKYSYIFLILSIGWQGCSDFLKEYSQNDAYVETAEDLVELILGNCYINTPDGNYNDEVSSQSLINNTQFSFISVLDDDSEEYPVLSASLAGTDAPYYEMAGFHHWMLIPNINLGSTEIKYSEFLDFYERINVLNAIMDAIPELEEKGESQFELLKAEAEALFLRAWNYFMLVNIYGNPYDVKNPDDPWGIPLKLVSQIFDTDFSRNTVGEVYDKIYEDLERSLECYELTEQITGVFNPLRASKRAVLHLLSRVSLYMEKYDKVIEYVDKIEGYTIADMRIWDMDYPFGLRNNQETIFSQGSTNWERLHTKDSYRKINFELDWDHLLETGEERYQIDTTDAILSRGYKVSEEFELMFDANDYRTSVFFTRTHYNKQLVCRKTRIIENNFPEWDPITLNKIKQTVLHNTARPSSYCWFRYSESILNKAEAEACLGKSEVNTTLTYFLTRRYENIPTIPSGKNELITFIRNERRKELCYEGHRWFDLRRYAVNSVHPEIKEINHKAHKRGEDIEGGEMAQYLGVTVLKGFSAESFGSWMLPIPESEIDINHGKLVNPPRNGVVRVHN